MNIKTSLKALTKFEIFLWVMSSLIVAGSFLIGGGDALTLITSLIGVTALIFTSKGDALGQVLIIVFSLGYGVISWNLRYYGEMITYLFMTSPIAAMSVYNWLKNPFEKQSAQVKVSKPTKKQIALMLVLTLVVTWIFYYILRFFGNASLPLSTVSIATSFLASYLTMLRSDAYALAYGANDIVLILLWGIAAAENPSYLPMVICFVMFLLNDIYGFINWRKIKTSQSRAAALAE